MVDLRVEFIFFAFDWEQFVVKINLCLLNYQHFHQRFLIFPNSWQLLILGFENKKLELPNYTLFYIFHHTLLDDFK